MSGSVKYIGAHVSSEPDVSFAPGYAHAIGARAMALFTAPQDKWRAPDPTPVVCRAFREECDKYGFTPAQILPHAGFMINLAGPDKRKLLISRLAFEDEMRRCSLLGLTMFNFHPGSTVGKIADDEALAQIAQTLNMVHRKVPGVKTVLENTAGQGSNLGWQLAHLGRIIELVDDKERMGVCIDTCHAFAAGYDLATPQGYDIFWKEFDSVIGRDYLCGMHLNDAKRPVGSRLDRHEVTGQGHIGEEFFKRLLADPRTDGIPLILETPDEENWPREIQRLYGYTPVQQ